MFLQIIRTSPIFLPECAFFLYDGNIQKGVDKSVTDVNVNSFVQYNNSLLTNNLHTCAN